MGFLDKIFGDPKKKEGNYYFERGQFYLNSDPDGALNAYIKATKCDPENLAAWLARGTLHEKKGDFEDALECFINAERISPNNYFAQSKIRGLKVQLEKQKYGYT